MSATEKQRLDATVLERVAALEVDARNSIVAIKRELSPESQAALIPVSENILWLCAELRRALRGGGR